ncbi:MAG: hypothetical protein AB1918_00030 [Pseudomonadota bacterium]
MALDRMTIIGLVAVILAVAWVHSPWWLATLGLVAGWLAYDRWARRGGVETITGPRGTLLPLADATRARDPRYVIGDFLAACCEARPGALLVAPVQLDEIIAQCASECRRVGRPEPPMVEVMNALEPYCATCALPYSPALLRQKWRDATCKKGVEMAEGAVPDEDGRCPRCGGETVMLVFEV